MVRNVLFAHCERRSNTAVVTLLLSDAEHMRAILEVYFFIGLYPLSKWSHMPQIDMQHIYTYEGYETKFSNCMLQLAYSSCRCRNMELQAQTMQQIKNPRPR